MFRIINSASSAGLRAEEIHENAVEVEIIDRYSIFFGDKWVRNLF